MLYNLTKLFLKNWFCWKKTFFIFNLIMACDIKSFNSFQQICFKWCDVIFASKITMRKKIKYWDLRRQRLSFCNVFLWSIGFMTTICYYKSMRTHVFAHSWNSNISKCMLLRKIVSKETWVIAYAFICRAQRALDPLQYQILSMY